MKQVLGIGPSIMEECSALSVEEMTRESQIKAFFSAVAALRFSPQNGDQVHHDLLIPPFSSINFLKNFWTITLLGWVMMWPNSERVRSAKCCRV